MTTMHRQTATQLDFSDGAGIFTSLSSKDETPKVSIVIPAFNAESWIRRAIDSTLRQTWDNTEIIVVNDGSTDGTAEVCRSYGDRIRCLRQEWKGASAARNLGIRESSGDLVGFLDADDELLPGMAADLVATLQRYPQAGVASGAHILREVSRTLRRPSGKILWGKEASTGILPSFFGAMCRECFTCVGSLLIRRDILMNGFVFREDLLRGEDVELWSRIGGNFQWAFLDKEVMIYHHLPISSQTLQYPDRNFHEWTYDESTMKNLIHHDCWPDYRRYRKRWLISKAKGCLRDGDTCKAKAILDQVPKQVRGVTWFILRSLSRFPHPLVLPAVKCIMGIKSVLRRIKGAMEIMSPLSGQCLKHSSHPKTFDTQGAQGL